MAPSTDPAHTSLDLFALASRVLAWPTAVLLAVGALAGWAAGTFRQPSHQYTVAWSFPPVSCPGDAPLERARYFDRFVLPATAVEGLGVRPREVPERLRGASLQCQLHETAEAGTLECALRARTAEEARRLAELADAQALSPASPLALALAEARIVGWCGWEYLYARGADPAGEAAVHSFIPPVPELHALRDGLARGGRSAAPLAPGPVLPGSNAGALLGLVLGLLLAVLVAALRARGATPPENPEGAAGRVATAALAGLLLTAGMDRVLVLDVGPFTLRAGHLFAVVLFAAIALERWKRARAFVLPARPVLAALLFLCLAALSALWSHNPAKSAGYTAWAGFDLLVVLAGIAGYARDERRLHLALRLWLAGMGISLAAGALQVGLWKLGVPPPCMDVHGFPRMCGLSYEPSYFALYLVPGALMLTTRVALLGRAAWRSGLLALLLFAGLGLSLSRSGWLGAAFGTVLIAARAWMLLGRHALPRLGIAAGAVALVAAVGLLAWPQMRQTAVRFVKMAVDRQEVTSSKPRLESLAQAVQLWKRHPALGVGVGGYGAYVREHPELLKLSPASAQSLVTTNLYLELAAETGAAGLAAALAMLLALLAPLASRLRGRPAQLDATRATFEGLLIAAAAVFLVLFQFSQTLWRLDTWVLLGLCFAAGLSARAQTSGDAAEGGRRARQHADEQARTVE
ncbi:MAG: O-antigen ligase family protein [Myxococcales bacterium]|jgi:hypothetical protein